VFAGIGQSVRHCHRWWDSWTSGRDERRCSLAGGQTLESLPEEGLTRISIELLLSSLMNAALGQTLTHSRDEGQNGADEIIHPGWRGSGSGD
jgi:hypothetical protein